MKGKMGEKELKIENPTLPSRGHSHPDPIALPVLSAAPYAPLLRASHK
jgi:hypothetical protein